MATADEGFKVRDRRGDKRYFIDNAFLKEWGAKLGPYSIAVYSVLALHADADSQDAYPSFKTMAELTGMSRRQVIREIKKLADHNIIHIEERHITPSPDSKEMNLSNVFTLLHPDEWGKSNLSIHEGSDTQSLGNGQVDTTPVTDSHQPSDTQSPPLVTGSHPNKTHPNKTQLTTPNGVSGKPPPIQKSGQKLEQAEPEVEESPPNLNPPIPETQPEPARPPPRAKYTPIQQEFLTAFNAKRFKNDTQAKTVTDMAEQYGENELRGLISWAATLGMDLGRAIASAKTALAKKSKKGQPTNGYHGTSQNNPVTDPGLETGGPPEITTPLGTAWLNKRRGSGNTT